MQLRAVSQFKPDSPSAFENESSSFAFNQFQMALRVHNPLHLRFEELAVCLNARAPHSAAFGAIEHTVVNSASIGGSPDHSIQSIDFANQMPFAQSANSGIAAHGSNCVEIKTDKPCAHSHSSRCTSCFYASMTAAND